MSKLTVLALALGAGVALGITSPGAASAAAALACDDDSGLCVDSGGAKWASDKSSSSKDRKKRSKKTAGTLSVSIDGAGRLFNQGIAISRDTLAQLETHVPLTHIEESDDRHMEYFDEAIGRKIVIRYVGDAKFKGVRSSFPVYEVDHEA